MRARPRHARERERGRASSTASRRSDGSDSRFSVLGGSVTSSRPRRRKSSAAWACGRGAPQPRSWQRGARACDEEQPPQARTSLFGGCAAQRAVVAQVQLLAVSVAEDVLHGAAARRSGHAERQRTARRDAAAGGSDGGARGARWRRRRRRAAQRRADAPNAACRMQHAAHGRAAAGQHSWRTRRARELHTAARAGDGHKMHLSARRHLLRAPLPAPPCNARL
jgi:hypothetical protein